MTSDWNMKTHSEAHLNGEVYVIDTPAALLVAVALPCASRRLFEHRPVKSRLHLFCCLITSTGRQVAGMQIRWFTPNAFEDVGYMKVGFGVFRGP